MAVNGSPEGQRRLGRAISIAIILSAAITGVLVLRRVTANPRTDDAEVFANYIGMAPLVNGPITHLYVSDNQLVKQGDPLFDIDDRPYAYALAHAKSDQQAFKGEISDERRAGKPRCARFTCLRPRLSNSGFDGSFTLSNVPPGSYYVVAAKAGYLSPRANVEDLDTAGPQPAAGQSPIVIPRVDVQADQTAGIDIRLERGAAVSGTVRFDDGSPASGVQVMLLHRSKDEWVGSNAPGLLMRVPLDTDDLGHYRISGLRDRDYLVQVILSPMDMESKGARMYGVERSTLKIYSGDTPHISDAVPFKLGAGEERSGEDITIPLSKFHSVSGVVSAASDGHPINSGHLAIEDPRDKESVVDAELGSDGTFRLEGVPEGTYTLRLRNASDKQVQEISAGGEQRLAITSEKTLHQ
jgi:Biotin-lipoyl like